jgi:hypothetical protein
MVNESLGSLLCAGLIGMLFGLALTFAGYRFFLFLLPIWGFFFGLTFGAQSMQALFGEGFLSTVTSWVVGFVVGAIFAVLSYLFWVVAVAVIAGSLGYAAAVGLLMAIGMPMGLIVWLVGLAAGIALALVTLYFNLQKWVVIIGTAVLGAGAIVTTMLFLFQPHSQVLSSPVQTAMNTSPLLTLLFIVLAVCGIVVQYRQNKNFMHAEYNRWETETVVIEG